MEDSKKRKAEVDAAEIFRGLWIRYIYVHMIRIEFYLLSNNFNTEK
jgi:hypothetical protein